jgi:hypothetical protein
MGQPIYYMNSNNAGSSMQTRQATETGPRLHCSVYKLHTVLLLLLSHALDPGVRDGHIESVVEAQTTLRHRPAQARHAAHILSNGDGLHGTARHSTAQQTSVLWLL